MSLFLRNLFFTILQPGIVAILIPFWLSGKSIKTIFEQDFVWHHYLGLIIFAVGFVVMLICVINFGMRGKGTLSPADPTKKLVISGLYKYSRNPMYIGVMLMLVGHSIFFRSYVLGTYALFIFIAFNLFIVFFEEPRLQEDFGNEYSEYVNKVGRWF